MAEVCGIMTAVLLHGFQNKHLWIQDVLVNTSHHSSILPLLEYSDIINNNNNDNNIIIIVIVIIITIIPVEMPCFSL